MASSLGGDSESDAPRRSGRRLPVAHWQLATNVLRTDSEGWKVSKFWKCQARCGESRTNVDKCSELALIVEQVLLQWGNVEKRMREVWSVR